MAILFAPIVVRLDGHRYRVIAGHMQVLHASQCGAPVWLEVWGRHEIHLTKYDYDVSTRILTDLSPPIEM